MSVCVYSWTISSLVLCSPLSWHPSHLPSLWQPTAVCVPLLLTVSFYYVMLSQLVLKLSHFCHHSLTNWESISPMYYVCLYWEDRALLPKYYSVGYSSNFEILEVKLVQSGSDHVKICSHDPFTLNLNNSVQA